MSSVFHTLPVAETHGEIDGAAKTVIFSVPAALTETFAWKPGQHITLRFTLNGEEVRRSYSISSSPDANEPLRITVKRVAGGLVSNHINDVIKPGDTIDVMPPFGSFCLTPNANLRRTHYFYGAGSGITPLYAMVHSVLTAEPHSVAHLLYGNTSHKTILFHDTIATLAETYADRVTVHHVLSKPAMWSTFSPWRSGMINKEMVADFIKENPPYAQDTQHYICGPGAMNQTVKRALMDLDVPKSRIHMESYGGERDIDLSIEGVEASASIVLDGQSHTVSINTGQTLLEAMQSAGLNPPFSCQAGVCGACRATLKDGTVQMRARAALDDADIESGAILTCQSVATSDTIALAFD